MLVCGSYVDQLLDEPEPQPFDALVILFGAVVLAHDVLIAPENYFGSHLFEALRWPAPLTQIPYVVSSGTLAIAVTLAVGAGGRQSRRRLFVAASAATSFALALAVVVWFVPALSRHLSTRDLYWRLAGLGANAPIGTYRFNASGAAYYFGGRTPAVLRNTQEVVSFLQRPERVALLVGTEALATIEQATREAQISYAVINDENTHYLLLSNRLIAGERDRNLLRPFVTEQPLRPSQSANINFDDKLILYGWDLPADIRLGHPLRVRLYFKVLAPLPRGYKVFLHFDGAGVRFQGDHVPLDGRFPAQNWVPGSYVLDEHFVDPDPAQAGVYQVFLGWFLGDTRLPIKQGNERVDADNRARLTTVVVR